jgi:hypothetical protein
VKGQAVPASSEHRACRLGDEDVPSPSAVDWARSRRPTGLDDGPEEVGANALYAPETGSPGWGTRGSAGIGEGTGSSGKSGSGRIGGMGAGFGGGGGTLELFGTRCMNASYPVVGSLKHKCR